MHLVTIPLWGALSDRIGRRPVYLFGAVGIGVWAFALFGLLDADNFWLSVFAITVGLLFHGAMYGPQAAFFAELFGTKSRYTGVGIGSQLASLVAGAPAPLIALALLGSFEDPNPTRVALYLVVCAVITVVAVFSYGETRTRDLAADHAVVPKTDADGRARLSRLAPTGLPATPVAGSPSSSGGSHANGGRVGSSPNPSSRRPLPMRVHDPNRRNLLDGKVALVTGGGGSLGLAIARLFLKEGARVVLADRNAEGLATTIARLDDVQVSTVVGRRRARGGRGGRRRRRRAAPRRPGRAGDRRRHGDAADPVADLDVADFDATLAGSVRGVLPGLQARPAGDGRRRRGRHRLEGGGAAGRGRAGGRCGRRARAGRAHAGGRERGGRPRDPRQHRPSRPGRERRAAGRPADPAGPVSAAGRDRAVGALPGLADEQLHDGEHARRRRRTERLTRSALLSPARCPGARSSRRAGRRRRW